MADRTSVRVLACTVLLAGFGQDKLWAQRQSWPMPSVKLEDISEHLPKSHPGLIRVQIFPHRRNFAPHWKDRVTNTFEIRSTEPCRVYEADVSTSKKLDTLITKTHAITFHAEQLRAPAWIECPAGFELVREKRRPSFTYHGSLYVKSEINKSTGRKELLAVNIVDFETYLRGVVPSEVVAGWPMESLKSQAVAARTYAMFHVYYERLRQQNAFIDVDDSIVYQAYTGVSHVHPRTDHAVEATRGEIVLFKNQIIQAYYHADSGGVTAACEQVFNMRAPYCVHKKEPAQLALAAMKWQETVDVKTLNEKLHQRGHVKLENPVVDVSVPEKFRTTSGRVRALKLVHQSGDIQYLSIRKFKRTIRLNSSLFSVKKVSSGKNIHFEFDGRGSGHGVGLNQRGAKILAAKFNWNYKKILSFYYSGTEVCSIIADEKKSKSCFSNLET